MLFYRAAPPLSAQTLSYTTGVTRRHRSQIGSAWRKLNPGQQALLAARPEAARGAGPSEQDRALVRSDRWHADPHRPGRRRPAVYSGNHRRHGMNVQVLSEGRTYRNHGDKEYKETVSDCN